MTLYTEDARRGIRSDTDDSKSFQDKQSQRFLTDQRQTSSRPRYSSDLGVGQRLAASWSVVAFPAPHTAYPFPSEYWAASHRRCAVAAAVAPALAFPAWPGRLSLPLTSPPRLRVKHGLGEV